MNRFTAVGLLLLFFFSCCEKEELSINDNNEIIKLDAIWSFNLHEGSVQPNSNIGYNLINDDTAVLPTTVSGKIGLTAVNITTGDKLWVWDETFQNYFLDIKVGYKNKHHFFFNIDNGNYTINLTNGSTVWKETDTRNFRRDRVFGDGHNIYLLGTPTDTLQEYNSTRALYEGSMIDGSLDQILLPNVNSSATFGGRTTSFVRGVIVNLDNVEYFLLSESDPTDNYNFNLMLSLYNRTEKQWVYKRKEVSPPNQALISNTLIVQDRTVFFSVNSSLKAYDILTGDKVWENSYDSPFDFSGYIIRDNKLIANSRMGLFYVIDPMTGETLVQTETGSSGSPIRYLNGIAYISAGGFIHAIDTDSGKHIWRLDGKLISDGKYEFRTGTMYVSDGNGTGKGNVIVATPEKAYCYEAL